MTTQLSSTVAARLENAGRLSLFAGFDGTLVALKNDPAAPRIDSGTAEILKLLASLDFVVATVISGRAVEDLYSRVGVPNLIYAGNHGMEIFGRNLRFVHPGASALRGRLEELSDTLESRLESVAGAKVEFKGLSTSVHFRNVNTCDVPRVEHTVRGALAEIAGEPFRAVTDDCVLDILPSIGWHKGTAARWINSRLPEQPEGSEVLSIYLGDDAGDEQAFRLMDEAVTIRVGNSHITNARYRIPDPAGVHVFLQWLSTQEAAHPRRA